MQNAIERNGVMIVRTPTGLAVNWSSLPPRSANKPVEIEVGYGGKVLKLDLISPFGLPWRDYFGSRIDHLKCTVTVRMAGRTLAELSLPIEQQIMPFMVLQGEQHHVTENSVSVPPALHITDEVGAVWTFGFKTYDPTEITGRTAGGPKGEYAFNVLRDGVDTGEIASRIERRNGKVRIFTRHGFKTWNGQSFF